ncbi:MAG: GTP cyclohydrolase II [Flavobacteriales bacterium]|nr:GTP cyclohydrolase II [Flavobacteriales bacterium]MDG1780583.1 GTP cyclohydrolase II [Flavobacteriales bacterium]MDG2246388.1 GTP cyclohydrolase II [Flavobacteriales bacterium]
MSIDKLAETRIPTVHGEFQMLAFTSEFSEFPHLAMVSGEIDSNDVINVRIHSECMTGDVFGSVRCDCGEQLDTSMDFFGQNGGVLLYLRQEGRGIGLVNKMKAYNFQDEGMDTIKANHALGFHTDLRDFTPAIEMLKAMGISRINLFTNNPEKVASFETSGIEVVERKALEIDPRKENEAYLRAKLEGMGHFLQKL